MKLSQLAAILGCGALLVGCAPQLTPMGNNGPLPALTVTQTQTSGAMHYQRVPTVQEAAKNTVTKYVPVPVPGQLMPAPKTAGHIGQTTEQAQMTTPNATSGAKSAPKATPEQIIAAANKTATVQPNASDFFNAMATYQYMSDAMYTVYTAPGQITDIQFQPGEKLVSEAAGDTLRWNIAQTHSGEGDNLRYHLLVKPTKAGISNTLIITTNKRVYHLILKSTTNNTFMVSVRWHYPGHMVTKFNSAMGGAGDASMPSAGSPVTNLNFNYRWYVQDKSEKRPDWMPTHIYSDNRQTIIEFGRNFHNEENMPVLAVGDGQRNGKEHYGTALANWRLEGGRYMVVDTLFNHAKLSVGSKKQGRQVVYIDRF